MHRPAFADSLFFSVAELALLGQPGGQAVNPVRCQWTVVTAVRAHSASCAESCQPAFCYLDSGLEQACSDQVRPATTCDLALRSSFPDIE